MWTVIVALTWSPAAEGKRCGEYALGAHRLGRVVLRKGEAARLAVAVPPALPFALGCPLAALRYSQHGIVFSCIFYSVA